MRGYEKLPNSEINDIDFGVSKKDLSRFCLILDNLSTEYNYKIYVDLVRLGVFKSRLRFDNYDLLIDVWWDFNYCGLNYLNIEELLKSKKIYNEIIYIPAQEYEFALSFLKEMLHNNIIRKDKIDDLKLKINDNYKKPFSLFFNNYLIEKYIKSVNNDYLKITFLSLLSKIQIFFSNIYNFGLYKCLSRVMIFFRIKYFGSLKNSKLFNE